VVWAPSYLLVGNFDTYQPIINAPTTIITFLPFALLQNTQRRSEQAVRKKLDAVTDGLFDLMGYFASDEPDRAAEDDLSRDIEDLRPRWASKRRCRDRVPLRAPRAGVLG